MHKQETLASLGGLEGALEAAREFQNSSNRQFVNIPPLFTSFHNNTTMSTLCTFGACADCVFPFKQTGIT